MKKKKTSNLPLKDFIIPKKTQKFTKLPNGNVIMFGKKVKFYTKKQGKNKEKLHNIATKVLAPIVVLTGIGVVAFFPIIKSAVVTFVHDWINEKEKSRRPDTQSPPGIPKNINPTDTMPPREDDTVFKYITLTESSEEALSLLKSKINREVRMYAPSTSSLVTPALVVIEYKQYYPETLTLICDIDKNNSLTFQYSIEDPEAFQELLESSSMEVTDIINGFNSSITSVNLIDIPVAGKKISNEDGVHYATKVIEKGEATTYNDLENNYNIEDFYIFNSYYFDGKDICKKEVRIKKEDAEKLSGFNQEDLNTVYELYKNHRDAFESSGSISLGMNNLSLIFLSAQQQKSSSNFDERTL